MYICNNDKFYGIVSFCNEVGTEYYTKITALYYLAHGTHKSHRALMLLKVSKPLESHKFKPVLINLMGRAPEGTHSIELFELVELMRPISCMIKFMIFLMFSRILQ